MSHFTSGIYPSLFGSPAISYPESSGFLVSEATPGRPWGHQISTADNLDPALFRACRGERSRALGNPGARLSLIGFSKKQ